MARGITTITTIVRKVDEPAPGIRRLVLADPDDWRLPPFRPGAHIDLHLARGLVRTYSLCNDPADERRYVVAIKLEPGGRGGSRHIHEQLVEGATLGVSIPRGGVIPTKAGRNVFVAGGIGVTPFVSALNDLERRGQTNYMLHWASRGQPTLIDMIQPAVTAGRVKLYDTRVAPAPDIAAILSECSSHDRAFCCGPVAMLDAFEAAASVWPAERKHIERFSAPKLEAMPGAKPFTVELSKSGTEAVVRPELGLLATLEDMDVDVSVSCAGGICGACRTRYTGGSPIHRDRVLTPAERDHEVIVCVAGCSSDRLVLEL